RRADPLAAPGESDLTAHVDFQAMAAAARAAGAQVHGPVPQAAFLRRLGIEARAAVLLRNATAAQATAISTGYRTLIDDARMGRLFKAFAIASLNLPTPAGFDRQAEPIEYETATP